MSCSRSSQAGDDETDADLAAWGAPDLLKQKNRRRRDDVFEVWPPNWDAVQLFLKVDTQWRFGAMGGLTGLDYPAIDVAVKFLAIDVSPAMFEGLQIMERVIVSEMNNRE